jgi:hypothetical protein
MICVHDRTTQEQAEAWQPLLLIHVKWPGAAQVSTAGALRSYSLPPRPHCVTACAV